MHKGNPEIIALAKAINRTASSVALKLCNFAHLDPSLSQKGASHGSRLDKVIWDEFSPHLENLIMSANEIRSNLNLPLTADETPEFSGEISETSETDRISTVKTRVGQNFFRSMVLSTYESKCCLTGIGVSEILVASHIVPWSQDKNLRLNPRNGLCLNVMHDKIFDLGLMSFDDDYRAIFSKKLKDANIKTGLDFLLNTEGIKIQLPKRFLPDKSLIQRHRQSNNFE
jgi:predicted restriction endonuclease